MVMETRARGQGVAERTRGREKAARNNAGAAPSAASQAGAAAKRRAERMGREQARQRRERQLDAKVVYEFGGPLGAALIMIVSHALVYYLYASHAYYDGGLPLPAPGQGAMPWARGLVRRMAADCVPTPQAAALYFGFLGWMFASCALMPGVRVRGLPVPSEGFKTLEYNCNALSTWYLTLAALAVAHVTGAFSLSQVYDRLGEVTTVAVLWGDLMSLAVYLGARLLGKAHRMSGNVVYDFFMGAWLNPRVLGVDLKLMAELRVAWIGLFLLTLSAAVKQVEVYGGLSGPMAIMVCAHFLYANACCKGEECVPTTWDISYEKDGWMLIFWNFAGVPLVYCYQSMYIMSKLGNAEHSHAFAAALTVILLGTYYVWDTCNSQKNRFKMQLRGTYQPRTWAFPQLPWGTLMRPRVVAAEGPGKALLCSGWYGVARKIHYTCDIAFALVWGASCGFDDVLPFFYAIFFTVMILHRLARDEARLEEKYGEAFLAYKAMVPAVFIPGVI